MKQSKFIFVIMTVFLLSGMTGCQRKERLYIFNWTYYTPDSVIEKFEKEFDVRVIYDQFASNEEMFAKIPADGGGGYDIVFPSADFTELMIRRGMLHKIDHSLLSNLGNIDSRVLEIANYDSNMEFSVPYYWGASGITVNTAHVQNFEKSWSIFSRQDLKSRMTMLDDMREVIGNALTFLDFSVNTRDVTQINAARDLINNSWKPNLAKFDADAFGKGFANGDFWVVQGYAENVFLEIIDNPGLMSDTVFFIPVEGGPAYVDSMVILRRARNVELAHKFIDFIHRPEIYAEFVDAFGLPATVNVPARALKKGNSWYEAEDLYRTELKRDLETGVLDLYTNVWFNSIRTGD